MPWAAPFPQQQTSTSCARVGASPSAPNPWDLRHPLQQLNVTKGKAAPTEHHCDTLPPPREHNAPVEALNLTIKKSLASLTEEKGRVRSFLGWKQGSPSSHLGWEPALHPALNCKGSAHCSEKHNGAFSQRIRP